MWDLITADASLDEYADLEDEDPFPEFADPAEELLNAVRDALSCQLPSEGNAAVTDKGKIYAAMKTLRTLVRRRPAI